MLGQVTHRESDNAGGANDLPCQMPGLASTLAALSRHDRESDWADFIADYSGYLRKVCREVMVREDWIDDAVQETLIRLQQRLPGYVAMGEAEAWAWLRLIATGCARNLLSSERARGRRERAGGESIHHGEGLSEDADDQRDRLMQALRQVTNLQCDILRRRFLEGHTNAEIALALGMTEVAVQRQGHRAITRLKLLLGRRELVAGSAMLLFLAALPAALRQHHQLAESASSLAVTSATGNQVISWMLKAGLAVGITATLVSVALVGLRSETPPVGTTTSTPHSARSAFVQRFQTAHPDWRRVDLGERLSDPAVWNWDGPWVLAADGRSAELTVSNPEPDLRKAVATLVQPVDPVRRPRLLVATLEMQTQAGHSGFRLAVVPVPAQPNGWIGLRADVDLTPDLMLPISAPHTGPTSRIRTIGIAVEAEGYAMLVDDEVKRSPRVSDTLVTATIAVYQRRMPVRQTIRLHDLEVYEAGSP